MESQTGNLFVKAASFAAERHRDQRRKNALASPYINHPLSVAARLDQAGVVDEVVLVAAVLHDTVEDTKTTLKEIEELFGEAVASVVAEVTDDKSMPKHLRKIMQIEHAKTKSTRAKLVKLADKLDNLSDLFKGPPPMGWSAERVQGYFTWAYMVVEGLRGTNASLEAYLDILFQGNVTVDGVTLCCVPSNPLDREEVLNRFLANMEEVGKEEKPVLTVLC